MRQFSQVLRQLQPMLGSAANFPLERLARLWLPSIIAPSSSDDISKIGALAELPEIIAPEQVLFDYSTYVDDANWKLLKEFSMEGYHIKSLHNKSFYPYGYDNLNVVETFGPNSRITFPFRRIEKLRDLPRSEWRIAGKVTYVVQIFPNTRVSGLEAFDSWTWSRVNGLLKQYQRSRAQRR